jgi:hypothetical protein
MSGMTKKAKAKQQKAKLRAPEDDNEPTSAEKSRKKFLSRFFVAMFVIPGFFGAVITIWGFLAPPYTTIALDNQQQLKEVFFGGFPWLIACAPYKGQPVNPIFAGVSSHLVAGSFKMGIIDCDQPMPSGKTVIERFKLQKQKKYNRNGLSFTVANGGKPKIVPGFYMQSKKGGNLHEQSKQLNSYVTKTVAVKYGNVKNGAQLTKQCLSKSKSALVLVEGDASVATKSKIERLAQKHRTLWFCVVDHTKFVFSLDKKFPDVLGTPIDEGEARLVLFRKKKKPPNDNVEKIKKGRKGSNDIIMARAFNGLITGPPDVDSFITTTMNKQDGMLLMEALRKKPTLRYRGKGKSEKRKSGKKKKMRRKGGGRGPIKKKKKREREKPRDETPEEKAQRVEREVKRRKQMDEQAQAHYAQAADDEEDDDDNDTEEENDRGGEDDVEEVYVEDGEEDEEDTINLDDEDDNVEM